MNGGKTGRGGRRWRSRPNRRGFTLIELNIALLLVALGMLLLFGLFPSALREGEAAVTDTHAGFFAEYVMSGIRANASAVGSWAVWRDPATFRDAVTADLVVGDPAAIPPDTVRHTADAISDAVMFPYVAGADENHLRYILNIGGEPDGLLRYVELWVWSGEFGPMSVSRFKSKSKWFYCEVFYEGEIWP